MSRRTHEIVRVRGVDRPTRYGEPTHTNYIRNNRPPCKRESLASFGGAHDRDSVVECDQYSWFLVAEPPLSCADCSRV